MKAGEVLDILQQRIGGQYSRNQLLSEVRHAQNEILSLPEVPFCRVPGNVYLATVDGTQLYTVPYRIVTRIFERYLPSSSSLGYSNKLQGKPQFGSVVIGTDAAQEIDYTFECSESLSATSGLGCTVRFPAEFNPGATTDVFLMEAYSWPSQITSEQSLMALPDQWITTLLYYAVKRRVEESAYGVDIYNDPKFQQLLRSFMTKQANTPKAVKPVRPSRF